MTRDEAHTTVLNDLRAHLSLTARYIEDATIAGVASELTGRLDRGESLIAPLPPKSPDKV